MKITITDQRSTREKMLFNLAAGCMGFAVTVLALLLLIVLDLAPRIGLYPGREYEALRITIELVSLLASAGFLTWTVRYRSGCE